VLNTETKHYLTETVVPIFIVFWLYWLLPFPPSVTYELYSIVKSVQRLDYGLDDRGSIPGGSSNWIFSPPLPDPASYPMGTGVCFPGVKRPGRKSDYSPPSSAEVKNAWSYTSTPQYVFMVWCLFKQCSYNFLRTGRERISPISPTEICNGLPDKRREQ
jgi:hypothetical protein